MELPNLNRIVDTYIPILSEGFSAYLDQLRRDVLPHVRRLQSDEHLRWFSFLIHGAKHLGGREPEDGHLSIHLRLEPSTDLSLEDFIDLLPKHFENPRMEVFSLIPGLEGSVFHDDDPSYGWKMHGEASEWVLRLLEAYDEGPSIRHVLQFLHFITNPLTIGRQCYHVPTGVSF